MAREKATEQRPGDKNLKEGSNLAKLNSRKPQRNNKSGIRGVAYCESAGKWKAHICLKGERYNLGYFNDPEEAAEARREAEQELFDPILRKYGYEPTSETEYQERLERIHQAKGAAK